MSNNKKTATVGAEAVEEKSTQIVAQQSQIVNVESFDPERQIQQAASAANALVKVLKPIKVGGKDYFQFEHWQTIAKFYGHSVGIESTKKLENGYEAVSAVYNSQGIKVGGAEAICTRDEKNWKARDEYAIKSMAQTRAMAKGLRSIFGYVAVLAGVDPTPREEIPDEGFSEAPQVHKQPSERQKNFIKQLCQQKGVTQSELKEMAQGKNPSQLIEALLAYQPQTIENTTIVNDQVLDADGKVIDVPFN